MNPNMDLAFAFIGTVGGVPFKLLRHHDIEKVVSGTEHDTVNVQLLAFCLRMVDQLPVDRVAKAAVLAHLKTHADFWKLTIDAETSKLLINQQNGISDVGDPNRVEYKLQEKPDPVLSPAGQSDADPLPKSTPPAANPKPVLGSDHNSQQIEAANAGAGCPGGGGGKKVRKNGKRKAMAEFVPYDILANVKTGVLALVSKVAEDTITVVISEGGNFKEVVLKDVASLADWIVIANAETDSDAPIAMKDGLTILSSDSAVTSLTMPTENETASLFTCYDELTEEGYNFIKAQLLDVVNGKAEAKILSVDTFQSIDFVSVKISPNGEEDWGYSVVLEIGRDGEGKLLYVRILSETLPAEVVSDLAKFLAKLPSAKASVQVFDQATAPAKLDRCVRDVTKRKVADFRKKNGRAPNKKEKQALVSSSWAICQAAMKK